MQGLSSGSNSAHGQAFFVYIREGLFVEGVVAGIVVEGVGCLLDGRSTDFVVVGGVDVYAIVFVVFLGILVSGCGVFFFP